MGGHLVVVYTILKKICGRQESRTSLLAKCMKAEEEGFEQLFFGKYTLISS